MQATGGRLTGRQASIWLVYLGFVFLEPVMSRGGTRDWLLALLSVAVFLPLYFGVIAGIDSHPRRAGVLVVAMAVLGFALVPVNTGGSTYVIFSASAAGFAWRPRAALAWIGALAATLALALAVLRAPFQFWMGFQVAMVVVIGVANTYAEHLRRQNAVLRRAHEEELEQMATIAERERIARDLHDLLGHTLSVIAMKSELASKLADRDPQRAVQEIRDVERVSREALGEVRAAVEGYRGRGVMGELRNAEEALSTVGVRLESEIRRVQLPARQESVLALALREAITNVVRHAHATVCRVHVRERAGAVILTISDDGIGGAPADGNGLGGMRERVLAAGGTLDVDGRHGMTVTVTFPFTESAVIHASRAPGPLPDAATAAAAAVVEPHACGGGRRPRRGVAS